MVGDKTAQPPLGHLRGEHLTGGSIMETITTEELVLKIENVMDAYGKMTMEQLLEALGSEFNSNMGDDLVITPTPMKDPDLNDQVLKHGTGLQRRSLYLAIATIYLGAFSPDQ